MCCRAARPRSPCPSRRWALPHRVRGARQRTAWIIADLRFGSYQESARRHAQLHPADCSKGAHMSNSRARLDRAHRALVCDRAVVRLRPTWASPRSRCMRSAATGAGREQAAARTLLNRPGSSPRRAAELLVLELVPAALAREVTQAMPIRSSARRRQRLAAARSWCCTTCWD